MIKPVATLFIGLTTGFLFGTLVKGKSRKTLFDQFPIAVPNPQPIYVPERETTVVLNFDLIATVYNRYGKDGVYAYLVDNNIAKDYRHGRFIIDHIFLPEYKRRNAVQQQSEIIEPPLS